MTDLKNKTIAAKSCFRIVSKTYQKLVQQIVLKNFFLLIHASGQVEQQPICVI